MEFILILLQTAFVGAAVKVHALSNAAIQTRKLKHLRKTAPQGFKHLLLLFSPPCEGNFRLTLFLESLNGCSPMGERD